MPTESTTLYERLRLVRTAGRLGKPARYALAAAVITLVALVRTALFAQEAPWFLFEAATVLVALLLGGGPAILATLLSAFAAALAIRSPAVPSLLTAQQWGASLIFVMVAIVLVGVVEALRSTLLRMEALLGEQLRDRAALAERSSFLSSVLASSTDCIKVLDLEGRMTFMSEGGQLVMEVSDFNQIAGCPWPSFWEGHGHADAVAALESARAGRAASFIGKADTLKGAPRWWHVAVSPVFGEDGAPERILSVSRDISALRESEAERDRYARLVENSSDLIKLADLNGALTFLNDAGLRFLGLTAAQVRGTNVADFLATEQVAALAGEILPSVQAMGAWNGELTLRRFGTGELMPVLFSVFPVEDAGGQLMGFGLLARDFRERKRAEERQALINGEISHRLKNVLAMVQAIAARTLRNTADPGALATFDQRLAALGKAQDALLQRDWQVADLCELASGALKLAGVLERCQLKGPAVRLGPRAALSTSLLLHELATNAQKYGALSAPEGLVRLRWGCEADDLVVEWSELHGPPAEAPSRTGFGSRLLKAGLIGTGGSELTYGEEGFSAAFRAPLDQVEHA